MYPDLVSGAFLGSDTVIGKIRSYYNQGRILIGYHKSFTDVNVVTPKRHVAKNRNFCDMSFPTCDVSQNFAICCKKSQNPCARCKKSRNTYGRT
jgi:hypothetical protein